MVRKAGVAKGIVGRKGVVGMEMVQTTGVAMGIVLKVGVAMETVARTIGVVRGIVTEIVPSVVRGAVRTTGVLKVDVRMTGRMGDRIIVLPEASCSASSTKMTTVV